MPSRALEYGERISFSVYTAHSMALLLLARAFVADRWVDASFPVRALIVAAHLLLPLAMGVVTYLT